MANPPLKLDKEIFAQRNGGPGHQNDNNTVQDFFRLPVLMKSAIHEQSG
jgi:hypothetical protein